MSIRLFLYLDEYKMYSISSQIFEGLTESITRFRLNAKENREHQKGPVGSGRILADIALNESQTEERKSLYDYAYSRFEEELIEKGILEITEPKNSSFLLDPQQTGFVKVKGKGIFNDLDAIQGFMAKFNKFGESLAYVQTHGERQELEKTFNDQIHNTRDRNEKTKLRERRKSIMNVARIASEMGLHYDEKFLEHIAFLLKTGFGDHFELQIRPEESLGTVFTAVLDRNSLREPETSIVKKYSRKAQAEFTLVGILTQTGKKEKDKDTDDLEQCDGDEVEPDNLREALLKLALSLTEVEESFFGILPDEIRIDPIAVYRDVPSTETHQ